MTAMRKQLIAELVATVGFFNDSFQSVGMEISSIELSEPQSDNAIWLHRPTSAEDITDQVELLSDWLSTLPPIEIGV